MKKIDAHLHFRNYENFTRQAHAVGHENTSEHLIKVYKEQEIECGIIMGNGGLELNAHLYPDIFRYCIGLDEHCLTQTPIKEAIDLVEQHLRRASCVGIKVYAGYSRYYVSDPIYYPFYELARQYHKPVAIHTGATAGNMGLLKYSHPLTLDEAATAFPDVQFVMCHFGNPWLADAAAVLDKNKNMAVDLSGIFEGYLGLTEFFEKRKDYLTYFKVWLQYLDSYDRVMYGTDWPLVNIPEYIQFIEHLIPEKCWEKVFYDNAKRIYQL